MKKLNCMNGYLTRIDFDPVPFFAILHLLKFEMKSQAKPSQAKPSQAAVQCLPRKDLFETNDQKAEPP
jgi:hypothetical protein